MKNLIKKILKEERNTTLNKLDKTFKRGRAHGGGIIGIERIYHLDTADYDIDGVDIDEELYESTNCGDVIEILSNSPIVSKGISYKVVFESADLDADMWINYFDCSSDERDVVGKFTTELPYRYSDGNTKFEMLHMRTVKLVKLLNELSPVEVALKWLYNNSISG